MEVVKKEQEEKKEQKIELKEIKDLSDGKRYHIVMQIPTNMGWITNAKLEAFDRRNMKSILLHHIENKDGIAYFEGDVDLPTSALYRYYGTYQVFGKNYYISKNNNPSKLEPNDTYKMSVNFEVPDWAKGKMMYHIFVDRFYRGSEEPMQEMPRRIIHKSWDESIKAEGGRDGIWNNDFYGGDLKGITKKLDYIKSLGVSILYLSPIVRSQSNHRYDAADYEEVDPYAGTMEDLKVLCEEAHKKGMKILLDGVFNHTGSDSKYYNQYGTFNTKGAYNNMDSPYRNYYRYSRNGRFCYWWGFDNLPECNCYSYDWQQYITGKGGVIDKWFDAGIDGLRLDVPDELTDEYLELIRKAVKRNKEDGFILGEVWENPMRKNRGLIDTGKAMDSVMNYHLADKLLRYFKYAAKEEGYLNYTSSQNLKDIIEDILREYPTDTINSLMNFTSTHDMTRLINILACEEFKYYNIGEGNAWNTKSEDNAWLRTFELTKEQYELGKKISEAYVFALAMLPGNLSIFYGDEVGVQGMGNLANRKPFPWNHMDKELLKFYRYIGKIRAAEKFLETADLKVLDVNKNTFKFERMNEQTGEDMIIGINRTDQEQPITLPGDFNEKPKVYSLRKSTQNKLNPYGAIAIKKQL